MAQGCSERWRSCFKCRYLIYKQLRCRCHMVVVMITQPTAREILPLNVLKNDTLDVIRLRLTCRTISAKNEQYVQRGIIAISTASKFYRLEYF
jgi:hypothetical protein